MQGETWMAFVQLIKAEEVSLCQVRSRYSNTNTAKSPPGWPKLGRASHLSLAQLTLA